MEVVQGDHLNRPDAALALARRWIDTQGVDMICEVNNSAIALAVANLVRFASSEPIAEPRVARSNRSPATRPQSHSVGRGRDRMPTPAAISRRP